MSTDLPRPARPRGPRAKRASIKDVATEAGVSLTTVSHVLNGKGRVDATTRERVLEAAQRLSYLPSRAARGLVSGRTYTLGLSLPQIGGLPVQAVLSSEWYAKVVVLASQRAIDRDYAVAVLPAIASHTDLARFSVDGVLVLDPVRDDPRLALLASSGVPHASVGHDPDHPGVPCVVPDVRSGARDLFTHLVQRGSRRILVLAGPAKWEYVDDTMTMAHEVCDPVGVQVEMRVPGDDDTHDQEALYAAVRKTTRAALTSDDPPDAVVGLFEGFGASILLVTAALGLTVPGDVRVAQDVDDASAKTVSPTITALDQHLELQAAAGIDLLLARVEGAAEVAVVTTPLTLRVREST